ncbi:hypothetical protein ACQ4PT_040067 [Festuca glaucescens]
MATSSSALILLLALSFAASASATSFSITNQCSFTVWPAARPPPLTLAEFTLGGEFDSYDISVIDGFNIGMGFSCSTGVALQCRDSRCPDAYQQPNDVKTKTCRGNRSFRIVFCP